MYPSPIQNLIDQFNKWPGIGPKTSERFVFYLLKKPKEEIEKFIWTIKNLKEKITVCSKCFNFSETDPCVICSNAKRNQSLICVVAKPQDIDIMEKTKEYQGVYFVLGGLLNTVDGITPDKLRVKELIEKISCKQQPVREIILALNVNLEGETTVLYLTKLLRPYKIKITRLARGLPMNSELEYADEVTLSSALKGRREI